MNATNYFKPLDLSDEFFNNIKRRTNNNQNEVKVNNYKNRHIEPPFRYYNDDTNLNLTPGFIPKIMYKNKPLFTREKPSQTEHDEIGINLAYLKKYYGYTDYGYFNVANQSLPEANKHKTTPKNNLFDLE
jgi:hypothetical protein